MLFKAPPEVTDTPSRTTLAAEGDVARIDLSALFAASDGGALTYFVASSDPTLATATIDGDTLTLASNEDGSEGAVTVTVTATDDDGLLVTLTFEVTVESQAQPDQRLQVADRRHVPYRVATEVQPPQRPQVPEPARAGASSDARERRYQGASPGAPPRGIEPAS